MLISKKNRREVYKYLFKEGVLYAGKDFNLPKHPEIDVPNLEVIKLMQSFKSKEYVTERYAWRHFYWCASHTLSDELSALCSLVLFLTDSGIEYLREFLNLPSEIVPATLKKSTRPLERGDARGPRRDGPPRRFGGEREGGERGGYRSEKTGSGAPGEFRPEFRGGGFGRGSAPQ
ncbi:40S ribosomal protein S10-1 [Chlorella vulgaris]